MRLTQVRYGILLACFFILIPNANAQEIDMSAVLSQEELQTSVGAYVYLDLILENGAHLKNDFAKDLAIVSVDMHPFFKQALYDRYRKHIVSAAITNGLTGGIGSLVEGDWIVGSVLTLGGIASLSYSVLVALSPSVPSEPWNSIFTYSGLGITIIGVSWPIITGIGPNRKLRTALSMP